MPNKLTQILKATGNALARIPRFFAKCVRYVRNHTWSEIRERLRERRQHLKTEMHRKHRFVVMDSETFREKWSFQLTGINLFVTGAVDALLCYSYSEFPQLVLATGGIPPEQVIRFRDYGLDFPEDGLYVTEQYYRQHPDIVEKFVRASKRGWEYARAHRDEALEISMKVIRDYNVATSRTLQRMMLEEVLELQVNPATNRADFAPVSRSVFDDINASLREAGYLKSDIKYEELIR